MTYLDQILIFSVWVRVGFANILVTILKIIFSSLSWPSRPKIKLLLTKWDDRLKIGKWWHWSGLQTRYLRPLFEKFGTEPPVWSEEGKWGYYPISHITWNRVITAGGPDLDPMFRTLSVTPLSIRMVTFMYTRIIIMHDLRHMSTTRKREQKGVDILLA